MINVTVYNETDVRRIPRTSLTTVVSAVCTGEGITEAVIRIILVSDDEIHRINREYLQHDYPTDVITFPIEESPLEGEIYISIDTAMMQATDYQVSLKNELMRLSAHGALHLAGYDDDTPEKRRLMSELETKYMA
ncbi:MAG: rRNA maturation RNase YbeY [Candidatus Kapaibacterium sp.]